MHFVQAPQPRRTEKKPLNESVLQAMLSLQEAQSGLRALLAEVEANYDGETAGKLKKILDDAIEAERIVNEDIGGSERHE